MNEIIFKSSLADAFFDSLNLFPFLLATYLLLEYLEQYSSNKSLNWVANSGKWGTVVGAFCGLLPQCGFAAAAANFYAAKIISMGTLIAVFLSTSDEMLPILISNAMPINSILLIVAIKFFIGLFFGLLCEILFFQKNRKVDIESLCKKEDCHCVGNGVLRPALYHALKITVFVCLITFCLNIFMAVCGDDFWNNSVFKNRFFAPVAGALVGLFPNCSASIALSQMWVDGAISFGGLIAGLSSGAGVGMLVLFRVNDNKKDNIKIVAITYISAVIAGFVVEMFGL